MFAWSPFPFIRYALALIGGILCYEYFPDLIDPILILSIFLCIAVLAYDSSCST